MLPAFRSRNYALFWAGSLTSNVGTWMQSTALGWLMYELTRSASWLGLVSFAANAPVMSVGLVGGAIADRADRRSVLVATQAVAAANAFLLAALTAAGVLEVWHVIGIALASGVALSFYMPVAQATMPSLVAPEDLMSAISLNSVQFNLARILGPVAAGFSYAYIGPAGCFVLNGASFLALIAALVRLELPARPAHDPGSIRRQLAEGFRYARSKPLIVTMLSLAAAISLFGFPYIILMPALARDGLGLGPDGLGMMMGSVGAGAVVGGLGLATLRDVPRKALLTFAATAVFSLALAAFSFAGSLALAAPLLFVAGLTQVSCVASLNTTLQVTVSDTMRGRIMSMLTFALFGLSTLGSLLLGFLGDRIGMMLVIRGASGLIVLVAAALAARSPEVFLPIVPAPVVDPGTTVSSR